MLQLTPQVTIFIASAHIDFRKGIDGLIAVCRNTLDLEPLDGALFMFYNRSMNAFKILSFDGQGFWLCTKRLSSGRFIWQPDRNSPTQKICYRSLQIILANLMSNRSCTIFE